MYEARKLLNNCTSYLDHTNLIYCFTSREASKSDSVGRPIKCVDVRHFEVMNLIMAAKT